jgi:DNA-binding NarL/FixJ family response regulator
MIQVSIYEDNQRLSELLVMMLESTEGFVVAGVHTDCNKVLQDLATEKPEVVLMDIDMPNSNGIAGVWAIKQAYPKIKVVMHTVFDDERLFESLRKGADGYILKKDSAAALIPALRDVMNGGAPMSPQIAKMVLKAFYRPAPIKEYNLTLREKDVLTLLTQGNSYKMIAAAAQISIETVRRHLQNIYLKLHVQSAPEAVAKAIREELVPPQKDI